MERPRNGMEDSKRRSGDSGKQTHAKPPPAAPGDLGSGDMDASAPPPEEKGGATDGSRGQRGARQGSTQNPANDPVGPGCPRRRVYRTVGLRSPGVADDT
jgi:hypothetical protein